MFYRTTFLWIALPLYGLFFLIGVSSASSQTRTESEEIETEGCQFQGAENEFTIAKLLSSAKAKDEKVIAVKILSAGPCDCSTKQREVRGTLYLGYCTYVGSERVCYPGGRNPSTTETYQSCKATYRYRPLASDAEGVVADEQSSTSGAGNTQAAQERADARAAEAIALAAAIEAEEKQKTAELNAQIAARQAQVKADWDRTKAQEAAAQKKFEADRAAYERALEQSRQREAVYAAAQRRYASCIGGETAACEAIQRGDPVSPDTTRR